MSQRRLDLITQALKERGYRLTPQRLAVLRVLAQNPDHPSVEEIHHQVRRDFPTTSLATIYKTVHLLKEMGEVLELGFAEWGSRYDGRRPYSHPHVICTQCGAVVDHELAGMADISREISDKTGYSISHHRLDFFGLCPRCRAAAK